MAFPRVFPFIGAIVAIAAVGLTIIGVSTDYWFSTTIFHSGLWRHCTSDTNTICSELKAPQSSEMAISALVAMAVAALLAIISGVLYNKTDGSNNVARLCGSLSVILLFSSGILIAASLMRYFSVHVETGYSFTLMTIAQFLSFMAAILIAHWMEILPLLELQGLEDYRPYHKNLAYNSASEYLDHDRLIHLTIVDMF
ncbi:unnamed protein product [Didymodactylos carnosus]|uniref:Uncharacterized protein n=1 Tax=Didymodactylos carnosus TaxID=1234261 RepID=A0A813R9P0_9BILA|nr:unnamed protein product [Didymodactylos carnosus]CAF3562002.1 unnamed protein product [Didymodactylos carnosus]